VFTWIVGDVSELSVVLGGSVTNAALGAVSKAPVEVVHGVLAPVVQPLGSAGGVTWSNACENVLIGTPLTTSVAVAARDGEPVAPTVAVLMYFWQDPAAVPLTTCTCVLVLALIVKVF